LFENRNVISIPIYKRTTKKILLSILFKDISLKNLSATTTTTTTTTPVKTTATAAQLSLSCFLQNYNYRFEKNQCTVSPRYMSSLHLRFLFL